MAEYITGQDPIEYQFRVVCPKRGSVNLTYLVAGLSLLPLIVILRCHWTVTWAPIGLPANNNQILTFYLRTPAFSRLCWIRLRLTDYDNSHRGKTHEGQYNSPMTQLVTRILSCIIFSLSCSVTCKNQVYRETSSANHSR